MLFLDILKKDARKSLGLVASQQFDFRNQLKIKHPRTESKT